MLQVAPQQTLSPAPVAFKQSESYAQNQVDRNWAAVFIDGSSIFYAGRHLGIEIDYSKLLYELAKNYRFLRAFFYTGVDPANEKQRGFLHWMRRHGYRVVTKECNVSESSKKVNFDVEIALDMMTFADCCETIILVSGDDTLAYAVNAVTYRGVQVEAVSVRSMMGDRLLNVCDRFIDLETLKYTIQKQEL